MKRHSSRNLFHRATWLSIGFLFVGAATAYGHEAGAAGGLVAGLTHPLFGWDHVVAMVAVGLWGGQLKSPAVWLLPITFPIVMALGGMLGARGVPLPQVEVGIAVSAIILGACVAVAARPPLWLAVGVVAIFAIFHGHAHGSELPEAAAPIAYGAGFVISTGLLHAAGITLGLLLFWEWGERVVRTCGAIVCVAGIYFLVGAVGA